MMSTPQLLKGFRDFLPEEAKKRMWLRAKMVEVFENWGFEPLETPTLEPLELFQGEIGEDEKIFFKFKDPGGRNVALRYDQTVPSVRVIGQYAGKLTFPFKRYQIQSAFRAEKPQKGRYREFVQADIDIFGIQSPIADAECIAVSIDLYKKLGFENPMALINNRDLLKGIPYPVVAAIDKIKKIGRNGVVDEIMGKGYSEEKTNEFLKIIDNLKPDETLKTIFEYLKSSGFSESNYKFEPTLARSFSYSQGPIWEMIIPGYSTKAFGGSVGGGERYDGMVERITGRKIPATGIAFGFDRTLEAAEQFGLVPKQKSVSQVLVTVFSNELLVSSIKVANSLRESGINSEVYLEPGAKLDRQLKYADRKGIPYAAILGPEEVAAGTVTIKDLRSGSQKTVTADKLLDEIY